MYHFQFFGSSATNNKKSLKNLERIDIFPIFAAAMSKRREKSKPQENRADWYQRQTDDNRMPFENQRQKKLADYLIDVSKYVLTGVVITSLFKDVTDKTLVYVIGIIVVIAALWAGLRLTPKRRKEQ